MSSGQPDKPAGELQRCDAFALLIPLTPFAQGALDCAPQNRTLLSAPSPYSDRFRRGKRLPKTKSPHRLIAKLDFTSILGRDGITFGHSRRALFQLPKDHAGISPLHFQLRVDPHSATLVFKDTSTYGTWISGPGFRRLLHGDAYRFEDADHIRIELGPQPSGMQFGIVLGEGMRDQSRRHRVFEEYVRSVKRTYSQISPPSLPTNKKRKLSESCAGSAKRRRSSQASYCF